MFIGKYNDEYCFTLLRCQNTQPKGQTKVKQNKHPKMVVFYFVLP